MKSEVSTPAGPALVDYVRGSTRKAVALVVAAVAVNGALFAALMFGVLPELNASTAAQNDVGAAHQAMLDEETGLRGFLLTGESQFLQPYTAGRKALVAANDAAERHLAAQGHVADLLLHMRLAEQSWSDDWAAQAATGPRFTTSAQRDAFIADGKALFDTYRATESSLMGALADQRGDLEGRARTLLELAGASALVDLGLVVGVAIRQRRQLRSLVLSPVSQLLDSMDRIRAGNLTAPADISGAHEFQQIGLALTSVAAQLRRNDEVVTSARNELEQRGERLQRLLTMARDVAGSLNPRYVMQAIAANARAIGAASAVAVWLVDGNALVERWLVDDTGTRPGRPESVIDFGMGVVGLAGRDGRAAMERNGNPALAGDADTDTSEVAIPMIVGARVVAVLQLTYERPTLVDDVLLDVFATLAAHAATALEAARLHTSTEELSQVDALTRLFNRRRLDTDLDTEYSRAARYQRPLAFVMLDVDHFKAYNDAHGHQQADVALEATATVLRETVRASDTVYRYGGEEFAVILRETGMQGALDLTERLRDRVQRHFSMPGGAPGLTASFGVAVVRRDFGGPADLVRAADTALYQAKNTGRNRVVSAPAE